MDNDLEKLFNQLEPEEQCCIAVDTVAIFGPCEYYEIWFKDFLQKEKQNFKTFRYIAFTSDDKYTC